MDNFLFELVNSMLGLAGAAAKALSPLIIGLILAYLLSPAVNWFEKKVKNRGIAIFITYVLTASGLAGLIYGFIILIVGALPSGGISYTFELISAYFEEAMSAVMNFAEKYIPTGDDGTGSSVLPDAEYALVGLKSWFSDRFSLSSVIGAVSSITGGLASFFIGAAAAVYLLKDKEFFTGLWEKLLVLILNQKTHGVINETMSQINFVVTTFIKGALVDSLIVAFLSSLVLTLLQVRFAVIIGVIGGILNIIPYFGPFFGMVPAFLVAFFSDGLGHGALAVLGLFLVQQLDSNYIYPKIVGATTGLHPLFVLLAVSIFGYFFGIIGMLLAVPAAGIVQVLITRWAYSRE